MAGPNNSFIWIKIYFYLLAVHDDIIFNTIVAHGKRRQEIPKIQASPGYIVRPVFVNYTNLFSLTALAHKLHTHRSFRSICPLKHVQIPNEVREGLETRSEDAFTKTSLVVRTHAR